MEENKKPIPRGLLGKDGKLTPKGTRLPSIRAPRDLTLGGAKKKVFKPKITTTREKNANNIPVAADSQSNRSRRAGYRGGARGGGRGRARGRGRGDNTIQTHSIFESGVTGNVGTSNVMTRESMGGGRSRSAGNQSKYEPQSNEQTKKILRELLKDDFLSDGNEMNADDFTSGLLPIHLPFHRTRTIRKLSKSCSSTSLAGSSSSAPTAITKADVRAETDPTAASVIKEEPATKEQNKGSQEVVEDVNETSSTTIGTKHALEENTSECISISEFLEEACTSEYGELITLQIPSNLPAEPPSLSNNEKSSDTDESDKKKGHCLSEFGEGYIGRITIHRSGKAYLHLGDVQLNLKMGLETSFLQELTHVKMNAPPMVDGESSSECTSGAMHNIGQVTQKLVCSPDIDSLLARMEQHHLTTNGSSM